MRSSRLFVHSLLGALGSGELRRFSSCRLAMLPTSGREAMRLVANALSMPSVKAAEILASRPGWWSGRCPCGCHAGAALAGYTDADTRAEMSVLLTP
jgi:hypothetical protein